MRDAFAKKETCILIFYFAFTRIQEKYSKKIVKVLTSRKNGVIIFESLTNTIKKQKESYYG